MTVVNSFSDRLDIHKSAISSLAPLEKDVSVVQQLIADCITSGGRILSCGNGGSAAESQHFATELCGRYRSNRLALPGISLNSDGTSLTCIGNDFGWDQIFARQVEAFGRTGDVFFAISTSGNSENVIEATKRANDLGLITVGLLGKGGGKLKDLVTHPLIVDSLDTAAIQECHLVLIHILCEPLEAL
jgi:D-sedoheptulose 7-phosphate isomerase